MNDLQTQNGTHQPDQAAAARVYELQELVHKVKHQQRTGKIGNAARAAGVILKVGATLNYALLNGPQPGDIIDFVELEKLVDQIEKELPPGGSVQLHLRWKNFGGGQYAHLVGIDVEPFGSTEIPKLNPEHIQLVTAPNPKKEPFLNNNVRDSINSIRACLDGLAKACASPFDMKIADVIKNAEKLIGTFTDDQDGKKTEIPNERETTILDPANHSVDVSKGLAKDTLAKNMNPEGKSFWPWDQWFGGDDAATAAGAEWLDHPYATVNERVYPQYDPQPVPETPDVNLASNSDAQLLAGLQTSISAVRMTAVNMLNYRFAHGASILANYRPGQALRYTMDPEALKKLGASDPNIRSMDALQAAFYCALQASPEARQYFSRATSNGFSKTNVMILTSVFGFAQEQSAGFFPGEIIRLAHPMSPKGRETAVVIESEGNVLKSVLVCPDYGQPLIRSSDFGEVVWRWMPAPMTVMSFESRMGQFWGPYLQTYRQIMENASPSSFWERVFRNASRPVRSKEEFLRNYGHELLPITNRSPIVPGALVFNDTPNDYAITATPFTFFCLNEERDKYNMITLSSGHFKPTKVWYPHL